MFKFLRKYSVWILAVGGTLLLIAFLAPNVITEFSRRAGCSGTVQATVGPDAEAIGFNDWQQVVAEAQVVAEMVTATVVQRSPTSGEKSCGQSPASRSNGSAQSKSTLWL